MIALLKRGIASQPAVLLVAGRIAGFAVTFAIPIVLARALTLAEFGTYKQIFLIWATLFGLLQLGFAESLYYFLPHRPAMAGRYVANALVSLSAIGALCVAALVANASVIGSALGNAWLADHMLGIGSFIALTLITAVFEIVLIARQRYLRAAVTYAASDALKTLGIAVPVALFGGLEWVLPGALLFACVRFLWMIAELWREFGATLRFDPAEWRVHAAYALPFALAVSLEVVQANLHQYVVAARFDAAAFAIYAVGCLQIPLVEVVASSAGNVLMVKMGDARQAPGAALALWHDTMCRIAIVIFPLTVFLLVAARGIIVTLFTAAYLPSVPIFMLWSLTIVPSVFCVDAVLRVHAQTRCLLAMNLVRLALVAVLIGWSLSMFGLTGAVIVVLVATLASRVMGLVRSASLLGATFSTALPYGRLATIAGCALVAGPAALWAARPSELPGVVALLWTAAVYATGYAMAGYGVWRRGGARKTPVGFGRDRAIVDTRAQ